MEPSSTLVLTWVGLGVIITLLGHLVTVAHYLGKISGKIELFERSVIRIEGKLDRHIEVH